MRVGTLVRLLKTMDQQAEVMLEVCKGENRVRYHARDVRRPELVGGSKSMKVIISNE